MFTIKTIKGKKYLYMQTHEIGEMLAPCTKPTYRQKERCLGRVDELLTWQLANYFFDKYALVNAKWEFHCLIPTKFRCIEFGGLSPCPLKGVDLIKYLETYKKRYMNRKGSDYDDWFHTILDDPKKLVCGICGYPLVKECNPYHKRRFVHIECFKAKNKPLF